MHCTNCGEKLNDNDLFCAKCGTKVHEEDGGKTVVLPTGETEEKPDTSGIDVSAYPTTVQSQVNQPLIQGTTPMPLVAGQEKASSSITSSSDPAQTYSNPVSTGEEKKKSKTPLVVAIIAAVVALVAIIALIVVLLVGGNTNVSNEQARGYASVKEQTLSQGLKDENSKEDTSQNAARADSAINSLRGYILPESDTRYYSESELDALSDYELYLARNEIYARHGREFKNRDLQDYFYSKDWYTGRYSPDSFDSIVTLNPYEKKNAEIILSMEKRRGSSYLG